MQDRYCSSYFPTIIILFHELQANGMHNSWYPNSGTTVGFLALYCAVLQKASTHQHRKEFLFACLFVSNSRNRINKNSAAS